MRTLRWLDPFKFQSDSINTDAVSVLIELGSLPTLNSNLILLIPSD